MIVNDIMSKNVISLSPEDEVTKLVSLLERYHIREIPVIEEGKLKGIVYAKDLVKKGIRNPSNVKIGNVMRYDATCISFDKDVKEAADLMFRTGLRAVPVIKDERVAGIISIHDIITTAAKTKQFMQTKVEQIMSVPETITSDTDIGKARALMREKNVSRFPVVDKDKKIIGLVTIFDMLKAIKTADMKDKIDFYSITAEKIKFMKIPVSTIMNTSPVTVGKDTSLSEVAGLIEEYGFHGIVVVDNKIPVGIIVEKDLLEFYISSLKRSGIYYQIIGLEGEEDIVAATAERMVRDTLQKMSKMFDIQRFFMHVKKYDEKIGRTKYSIRTKFITGKKVFVTKSHAWDLRDAVNEALTKLETIVLKDKERARDKAMDSRKLKKLLR